MDKGPGPSHGNMLSKSSIANLLMNDPDSDDEEDDFNNLVGDDLGWLDDDALNNTNIEVRVRPIPIYRY